VKQSIPTLVTDHTARGHVEATLGKGVYCSACGMPKPKRGGWSLGCTPTPAKDSPLVRRWMGDT
jgi:hypothetical protein